MLLDSGADTDCVNSGGNTVLHLCAISGYVEMAQQLVSAGADPTVLNNAGVGAAQLATQYSHDQISDAIGEEAAPGVGAGAAAGPSAAPDA